MSSFCLASGRRGFCRLFLFWIWMTACGQQTIMRPAMQEARWNETAGDPQLKNLYVSAQFIWVALYCASSRKNKWFILNIYRLSLYIRKNEKQKKEHREQCKNIETYTRCKHSFHMSKNLKKYKKSSCNNLTDNIYLNSLWKRRWSGKLLSYQVISAENVLTWWGRRDSPGFSRVGKK